MITFQRYKTKKSYIKLGKRKRFSQRARESILSPGRRRGLDYMSSTRTRLNHTISEATKDMKDRVLLVNESPGRAARAKLQVYRHNVKNKVKVTET